MQLFERVALAIRHHPTLAGNAILWEKLRPIYEDAIGFFGRKGLRRVLNGTDPILILPELHGLPEVYEPVVWRKLLDSLEPGDVVADVGAFVGLYTVAIAKRLGREGQVIAFEPDADSFRKLVAHIELNHISARAQALKTLVGDQNTRLAFDSRHSSESHISASLDEHSKLMECVTLDTVFAEKKLDILKVDVEGYEEKVFVGAKNLLLDRERCPRTLFVEIHPFAWPMVGTTSESLLSLLKSYGYVVLDLDEKPVTVLDSYCEIVAYNTK